MLHQLNFKKSTKFTPRAYDFLSHFFFFCKSSFYSSRHGFPCKHKLRVTDYFYNSCVSIIQVGTSWLVCVIEVYRVHSLLRQLVSFFF